MPITPLRTCVAGLAALLAWGGAQAQQQDRQGHVEVLNADSWNFDDSSAQGAQRLIGQVRLAHNDVRMWCDSAYLYPDDRVSAFSNVVLQQGDTLRISGDRLDYTAKTRQARMTGAVQLTDKEMELTTNELTYAAAGQTARYEHGGRLQSWKGADVLTSRQGTYHARTQRFTFIQEVRLVNPERTITADTLSYHPPTQRVDFIGPTWIRQEGTDVYCERGNYDPRTAEGWLTRAGRIISKGLELTGDSLYFNGDTGDGMGWGHVVITDTANHTVVKGEVGTHRADGAGSMVTERAELLMGAGPDTIFLHADTLFAHADTNESRVITARRNVRFFRADLQGVCDTMRYAQADGLVTLLGDPFLWHEQDQISGDTIRIRLKDGKVNELLVNGNAFMAAQVDSIHFDQVASLVMNGHFQEGVLKRMVAEGNGRTLYHATEKQDGIETVTGVNRADCSVIVVDLDSGQVSTVSFLTQPSATLYPLSKVPQDERELEGFRWNGEARPTDREDIFRPAPAPGPTP